MDEQYFAPIKRRILELISSQGDKKDEILNLIGVSKSNFSGIGLKSEVGGTVISKILNVYPSISAEWLITGNGDMLKEPIHSADKVYVTDNKFYMSATKKSDTVPLYSIDSLCEVASSTGNVQNLTAKEHITVPRLPLVDGAVPIKGDGMYPLLKSGDIVIFKVLNDKTNFLWGEMYLLSFEVEGDNFTTVKYVHKSESEKMVRLVSHNQDYQPKDIPIEAIRFAALVKASVRISCME